MRMIMSLLIVGTMTVYATPKGEDVEKKPDGFLANLQKMVYPKKEEVQKRREEQSAERLKTMRANVVNQEHLKAEKAAASKQKAEPKKESKGLLDKLQAKLFPPKDPVQVRREKLSEARLKTMRANVVHQEQMKAEKVEKAEAAKQKEEAQKRVKEEALKAEEAKAKKKAAVAKKKRSVHKKRKAKKVKHKRTAQEHLRSLGF